MREAAWGRSDWEDAIQRLVETLPGSMASFVNLDLLQGRVNALHHRGFETAFIESYLRRYADLNPWTPFWIRAPNGYVGVSERDHPASTFRNTDFYRDWLAPQGNAEAAAGLKLEVDPSNAVQLVWHYDVKQADAYDRQAAEILTRVRPVMAEVVRGATILRANVENATRLGGLIEHIDGMALMLDRNSVVHEANDLAEKAMSSSQLFGGSGDQLQFRDPTANRWLEEAVASLLDGTRTTSTTASFVASDTVFRATLTRAPHFAEGNAALLVAPRPRVLLVVKVLVGSGVAVSVRDLKLAFGLSSAESRLCELLVNGLSLANAASELGVSEGTVRQRLKMIFHKTATHRQGELVALISRFRISG